MVIRIRYRTVGWNWAQSWLSWKWWLEPACFFCLCIEAGQLKAGPWSNCLCSQLPIILTQWPLPCCSPCFLCIPCLLSILVKWYTRYVILAPMPWIASNFFTFWLSIFWTNLLPCLILLLLLLSLLAFLSGSGLRCFMSWIEVFSTSSVCIQGNELFLLLGIDAPFVTGHHHPNFYVAFCIWSSIFLFLISLAWSIQYSIITKALHVLVKICIRYEKVSVKEDIVYIVDSLAASSEPGVILVKLDMHFVHNVDIYANLKACKLIQCQLDWIQQWQAL